MVPTSQGHRGAPEKLAEVAHQLPEKRRVRSLEDVLECRQNGHYGFHEVLQCHLHKVTSRRDARDITVGFKAVDQRCPKLFEAPHATSSIHTRERRVAGKVYVRCDEHDMRTKTINHVLVVFSEIETLTRRKRENSGKYIRDISLSKEVYSLLPQARLKHSDGIRHPLRDHRRRLFPKTV